MTRDRADEDKPRAEAKRPGKAGRRRAPKREAKPQSQAEQQTTAPVAEPEAVPEAPCGEEQAPETQAAPEAAAEEAAAPKAEPASVYDVLREFANVLMALAWQRLGLLTDPLTGTIHRDMSEARVAIDTFSYLIEQIGDNAPEDQRRALRNALADLRINFVEQSKRL